jgi:hypothetical protein
VRFLILLTTFLSLPAFAQLADCNMTSTCPGAPAYSNTSGHPETQNAANMFQGVLEAISSAFNGTSSHSEAGIIPNKSASENLYRKNRRRSNPKDTAEGNDDSDIIQ